MLLCSATFGLPLWKAPFSDTHPLIRESDVHDTPAVTVWLAAAELAADSWVDAYAPPPAERTTARSEMTMAGDCAISERKRPIAVSLSLASPPVRGRSRDIDEQPPFLIRKIQQKKL